MKKIKYHILPPTSRVTQRILIQKENKILTIENIHKQKILSAIYDKINNGKYENTIRIQINESRYNTRTRRKHIPLKIRTEQGRNNINYYGIAEWDVGGMWI